MDFTMFGVTGFQELKAWHFKLQLIKIYWKYHDTVMTFWVPLPHGVQVKLLSSE